MVPIRAVREVFQIRFEFGNGAAFVFGKAYTTLSLQLPLDWRDNLNT